MFGLLGLLQLSAQHEMLLLWVVLPITYFVVDSVIGLSGVLLSVQLENFHAHVRNPRNQ
jgi:hypothetical protein